MASDRDGVQMTVRPVTVEDMSFWSRRGEKVRIVSMRGDHIGAENIEVLRNDRGPGDFQHCWRVPFVIEGDPNTYWFTMFSEGFPAVAAVVQPGAGLSTTHGDAVERQKET